MMVPLGKTDYRAIERACRELGWEGSVCVARAFFERLTGFLTMSPVDDAGTLRILVLPSCQSVHTWFMRGPLDIAFADREGCVLDCQKAVAPGRVLACPGAYLALERPAARDGCIRAQGSASASVVRAPSCRAVAPPIVRAAALPIVRAENISQQRKYFPTKLKNSLDCLSIFGILITAVTDSAT